jgi:tRNA(His) guanylyltransferase
MELGDRMKAYEEATRLVLPIRMPVVIRLDGKAFHTLTRYCAKPYDANLRQALVEATQVLLEGVPGRMAYHQSDEVSVLLIDYNRFDSQQWFKGCVQKMVSVAASIMGVEF